jgi:RNA polymerase sigma factor (sigma-70 family)
MVHDHGRAEDITQEVFMSALRRMRETERPIIFKPWVYEIAKNACIDAFRRSKRAEEVSYDADEGLGSSDYGRLVSSTPTPDAAVDTRQSLDHLRGAFGGLSETHHDILVMRELEGLSYREIGRRLGMSRPSVESTLFRARRRLTEEYAELTSGERCMSVQSLIAGGGERRLGVRDERKLARHVSHCQPCRRAAYSAGFDVAALAAKQSLGRKVAALLPFPAFVKRWFGRGGDGDSGGTAAKLSTAASQYAEPMSGWVKAAAVAATVAVAGAGAGVATTHGDPKTPTPAAKPAAATGAAPAAAQRRGPGATTSTATGTTSAPNRSATTGRSTRSTGGRASSEPGAKAGGSATSPSSDAKSTSSTGTGGSSAKASGTTAGSAAKSATGAAGKAVNGTTSAAGKAVNDTTKAVDQTVSGTTGAVGKTVNGTTGAVNEAVGTATGAVDKATHGATAPVSGAVNGAANTATGAVNGAANTATGAVNGAANTATGAVNGAASTATGAVNGAVGTAQGAAANPAGTAQGAVNDPVGTVGGTVGGLLPH